MARKTILTVVCGYCGKFIGTKPGYGVSGVTTGICKECDKIEEEKLVDQIAESKGISKESARRLIEKWNAENP